jgi:hypothetical protein
METTITDGQLINFLQLLKQKGMTPKRFEELKRKGILADVCDPRADLSNRDAVRAAFGLNPSKKKKPPKIIGDLLEEVGKSAKLPAITRFVLAEKFVVNTDGELPISGMGTNFQSLLVGAEENVKPMTVKQRKLLKKSLDGGILSALGDKDVKKAQKAKIAFAHIFEFLKTADRSGWYIFYPSDGWAVGALWNDGGWDFRADSVERPRDWGDGSLVVSR